MAMMNFHGSGDGIDDAHCGGDADPVEFCESSNPSKTTCLQPLASTKSIEYVAASAFAQAVKEDTMRSHHWASSLSGI